MTKPHKWHKEIKAWADGEEVQVRFINRKKWNDDWTTVNFDSVTGYDWNDAQWEFRIKPQPKEPQYLYVYYDADKTDFEFWDKTLDEPIGNKDYIGKIKLEE